jgi:hypothetical protein
MESLRHEEKPSSEMGSICGVAKVVPFHPVWELIFVVTMC